MPLVPCERRIDLTHLGVREEDGVIPVPGAGVPESHGVVHVHAHRHQPVAVLAEGHVSHAQPVGHKQPQALGFSTPLVQCLLVPTSMDVPMELRELGDLDTRVAVPDVDLGPPAPLGRCHEPGQSQR
jgi:hypothetical protein